MSLVYFSLHQVKIVSNLVPFFELKNFFKNYLVNTPYFSLFLVKVFKYDRFSTIQKLINTNYSSIKQHENWNNRQQKRLKPSLKNIFSHPQSLPLHIC